MLDPGGGVLADSAPPGAAVLGLVPADLAQADRHAHAVREIAGTGDVLRLAVEAIVLPGGQRVDYVAWADSTRPLRDLLATVSSALLVGGALVIGLALAGGLVLARRALARGRSAGPEALPRLGLAGGRGEDSDTPVEA